MALPLAPEAMERAQIAYAWMNTLVIHVEARAVNMQRVAFSNLQGSETVNELRDTVRLVTEQAQHAGKLALYVYHQHLNKGVETSAVAGMKAALTRLKAAIEELDELGKTVDAVSTQPLLFPSQ